MEASWFRGRLIELRTAAGLSRKELAQRAGLQSAMGIRDIEQGRRLPNWETVVALCKALGVSSDAFLEEPAGEYKLRPGRPAKAEVPKVKPPSRKRQRSRA